MGSARRVISPSHSIDVKTEIEQMRYHLNSPWSFLKFARSGVQSTTVGAPCTVRYQEVEDCRHGIGGCNTKDDGTGFGAVRIRVCAMSQEPTDEILVANDVPYNKLTKDRKVSSLSRRRIKYFNITFPRFVLLLISQPLSRFGTLELSHRYCPAPAPYCFPRSQLPV